MKNELLSKVYYRGNEFVLVQKVSDEFEAGSVICVDANEDGIFEYEAGVGKDGICCLTFEFAPTAINKDGQPFGKISMFFRSADGIKRSDPTTFQAIQQSSENLAKAIPVNCAVEVIDGEEYPLNPGMCTCTACSNNDTLMASSLEGFSGSFTPTKYGVETFSGKYRSTYPITSFNTRMLGFNLNLHHSSMVKYDGPVGQSFSHSFNMMIVRMDELTGQVITPDLRIYDISSEDGINWHLPTGFYSRLCREPETQRWVMTHYSGLEIAFYEAIPGCPGYPISITDPNGNAACMSYDASGYLQDVTTDLGQLQIFQYDNDGRFSSFSDHINRTWQFPHDGEGRLSSINTPATIYTNIPAGREITDKDLSDVLVTQQRCWVFSYQNEQYPNQISAETDPRGATYRENMFDDQGRVITARINGNDVRINYDVVDLPLGLEQLEPGNRIRSIVDREDNITYQEIHGFQGGPKNGLGRFGLRRSITLTERGKGNAPLRDDEPEYWEQRWLQNCDCLVPIVETQMFSSNDLTDIQFDEFGIPQNMPREVYTFNRFRQKLTWTYTDGANTIKNKWTYQRHGFGDEQQFSRLLTETDAREFDDNLIYAGINFINRHQYNDFGNHIQHDAPTVSLGTETPQKITEQWTFNDFGQPLSHTNANNNITNYIYFDGTSSGGDINTKGQFGGYLKSVIRGADGSADPITQLVQKYKVNALGMTTRRRDENGFNHDTEYNNLQEVVQEQQPDVTLNNGQQVRYETRYIFDGVGNMIMTRRSNIDVDGNIPTNAWIDHSVSYDIVNNPLSERVEVDENDVNDLITRYTYDKNDDQAVVQKPEGNRNFMIYDERQLSFKTFYGVAAEMSGSGAGNDGTLPLDYPNDKRALTLGQTTVIGLSINAYDARFNTVRNRDGRGNFKDHFFDFYNRETASSNQNGNGWVREFDDASNVLTESRGAVSKITGQITELLERSYNRFDEAGRQYQQVHDIDLSTDESTLLDPDDANNSNYLTVFDPGSRVIMSLDANGNPTSMNYDAADRLLTRTDALGNQQNNLYDANSNIISITELELPDPSASGNSGTYVTTFVYDEINRSIEQHIRGLDGNSIDHAWFFAYDSRNNQRLVQDAENNFTLTSFDDSDRQIMMQRFDSDPFIGTPAELLHYEWAYDKNSNATEERALSDVNDPNSLQVTRHAFDDLDRPIRTVYPDSDDPIDGSSNGPDDIFDRIEMRYDENSNPIQVTDQRGVVFNTQFDPGNRPTKQDIILPDDVPGTTRQTFIYDALDRTTSANNNYANVAQIFDAFSRLTAETQSIRLDGTGFDQGWEQPIEVGHLYDKQSNRIACQVLDGNDKDLDVATTFDALNRTDSISAAYFKTPRHSIARYAYIGPGRVQQKTLGNGAALNCTYDAKRRLRTHQWNSPNRLLVGFEYDYDRMDNTLFERFNHDGGRCDHFQYNNRYEVTGVSYRVPSSVAPTTPTNTFDYDDVFNRRQASFGNPFDATANTNDSYAINKANEYTQLIRNGNATTPTHDRAGNSTNFLVRPVTSNPNQQDVMANARWDAFNLLFDINPGDVNPKQDYRYDPLRRRIATMELDDTDIRKGSRRYIYDGWSVVEERLFDPGVTLDEATSTLDRIYINGRQIDEPLLTAIDRDQDGVLGGNNAKNVRDVNADQEYYFLNNRLGSVMGLLDADLADRVLEYYRYSVYGEATVLPVVDGYELEDVLLDLSNNFFKNTNRTSQEFGNVYLYTARRFDEKVGLYYYRARYFENKQGKFIQRDPLNYLLDIIDFNNAYHYVCNNPMTFVDPLGLFKRNVNCGSTIIKLEINGCTSTQMNNLETLMCETFRGARRAWGAVYSLEKNARNRMRLAQIQAQLNNWFGGTSGMVTTREVGKIEDVLHKTYKAFEDRIHIECACSCTPNVTSYAIRSKDKIYLCPFFWNSSFINRDRIAFIYHELIHAYGEITDFGYISASGSYTLGGSPVSLDTDKLIGNADTFEEFVKQNYI